MIDAGIEAEFLGHITAFIRSSCDAEGVGTLDPGDLVKLIAWTNLADKATMIS